MLYGGARQPLTLWSALWLGCAKILLTVLILASKPFWATQNKRLASFKDVFVDAISYAKNHLRGISFFVKRDVFFACVYEKKLQVINNAVDSLQCWSNIYILVSHCFLKFVASSIPPTEEAQPDVGVLSYPSRVCGEKYIQSLLQDGSVWTASWIGFYTLA